MDIAPIKTQRDYRRALKQIENLMTAKRGTPQGDRLDVLATLIEAWERQHYPLDLHDPVEAIKYHMDQNGLKPRDLIPFIGSRNRVHEVLNRRIFGKLGLSTSIASTIAGGDDHPGDMLVVRRNGDQPLYITFQNLRERSSGWTRWAKSGDG
jgi:HTH-type transcriptional regulator/antitoxin HigA